MFVDSGFRNEEDTDVGASYFLQNLVFTVCIVLYCIALIIQADDALRGINFDPTQLQCLTGRCADDYSYKYIACFAFISNFLLVEYYRA